MDRKTKRQDVGVTRWTNDGKDADAGCNLCYRLCDKFFLHAKLETGVRHVAVSVQRTRAGGVYPS